MIKMKCNVIKLFYQFLEIYLLGAITDNNIIIYNLIEIILLT